MRVTIDGESQDMPVTLKRATTPLESDALFVGPHRATRVTHSYSDELPVIVQVEDMIIEIPRQEFYQIAGMHYDWQPGDSAQPRGGA